MFSLRYLKVWVGGAILTLLMVCGVAAPLLAPRDPQAQTLEDRLRPPRWVESGSPAYLLGTDNLGRCRISAWCRRPLWAWTWPACSTAPRRWCTARPAACPRRTARARCWAPFLA